MNKYQNLKTTVYLKRKGVSLPINISTGTAISLLSALFFLAIVQGLIMQQRGTDGCSGPMKAFASLIRDATETNIC